MTSASALVPLWNRTDEWTRRMAMVREARLFLYLSTFYIEYDSYGRAMLGALLDAQRRGVTVNLLVDGFGQRLGGVLMSAAHRAALAALLGELAAAGARVVTYRPRRVLQRWLGGGQHVKIQVSEAGEAIFGSSNLSRSSFEGWNEYAVALRGPVVPLLLASYRDIGGEVDESHLAHLQQGAGTGDVPLDYWLCNPNPLQGIGGPLGWRGPNSVTDRLIAQLDAARHSIRITSFYFKPVAPLLSAVVAAARRGVEVEIHHSHRDALPATDMAWIAAAARYRVLLAAGVRIYENRRGEHSKIVLIDDAWAAFGSYNFEHAAHERLAEAMLVCSHPQATQPAAAIFAQLRQHADVVEVTSPMLRNLPRRLKLRVALLGPFRRWT